jgi:LPS-assembly protein
MRQRRRVGRFSTVRRTFSGVLVAVCLLAASPLQAALLPEGFFDRVPEPGTGRAAIEADYLSQDAQGVITASGQVDMVYKGYYATADRLIYNQRTNDVELIGNVVIRDPGGVEYSSDHIVVTGNFKKAILQSMVMVTAAGAMVTSSETDHDEDDVTLLEEGTYSPCGTCIDSKGRRIGWRVRTERMIYDQDNELIDLHQPILEVLGYPVAWLPWVRLPDPSNPRAKGFRLPSYAYSKKIGLKLTFPYFYPVSKDIDLTLEPSLMSTQGGLLSGTLDHRLNGLGDYSITASGLYQLDRSAFAGGIGDADWRGAVQTSARFTPTDEWTVGGAYSILSDRAYLRDYLLATRGSSVNQVYAEYLTFDTYGDIRVQEYVVLGSATQADQDKQALAMPRGQIDHAIDLGSENGQVRISGNILHAQRADDHTSSANGVSFVHGYEGTKTHGSVEAGWTKQWTTAAGVILTPYAGLRADFARYDGASALNPTASELYNLTPIAALDVRYPFVSFDRGSTHIIEPIAQIVYRGSDKTAVGITNDNAQSFVFDDTNLFSFNKFSGSDRQETGLRANIGGHYLANFEDGSYLDFIAGQSYHLAGVNAFGIADAAQTGTSTGLGNSASYIAAGINGAMNEHVNFGGKVQIDPANAKVVRTALYSKFRYEGWELGLDYAYAAADPALGATVVQQDVGGSVRIPLHEYWYLGASVGYNITKSKLLSRSATLTYDDGYFAITGLYSASGADAFNPSSQSYKITFKLKGPDGSGYGF